MANRSRNSKLFGTDGVRGLANHFPMTVEVALTLGKAMGKWLRKKEGKHRVVIGKDTRLSCYMFENALIAGLCSMGVDTLMVGPLPTPGVAFITRAYRADAGIMISASHNPYQDNGIKIFSSDGFKLPDSVEDELEEMVLTMNFADALPANHELGKNTRIADADGRYIEFAKATFPKGKTLEGMKIFLDCAHGATHRVAPLTFWELGGQVALFGDEPNGFNINAHCGSLYPQAIQKGVLESGCEVGIAFDGDGDRVIMCNEKGEVVEGDILLAICAEEMKREGLLQNNRVVTTQMTNLGVCKYLTSCGIEVVTSKVGDRYVLQDMLKRKSNLGGEQSGHLIFLDYNTTGDGIVTALQVLRIMKRTGKKLSQLATKIKKYPQLLINVPVKRKPAIKTVKPLKKVIEDAKERLGDKGRILVRYSGTENVCRTMVEGAQMRLVEQIAEKITKTIKNEIGG